MTWPGLSVRRAAARVVELHAPAGPALDARPFTILKALTRPLRRFIGDLSNLEGKLFGLDLRTGSGAPKEPE